jgi:hypothetical protein
MFKKKRREPNTFSFSCFCCCWYYYYYYRLIINIFKIDYDGQNIKTKRNLLLDSQIHLINIKKNVNSIKIQFQKG